MSKEVVMSGVTMPKLCECGCGKPAPIAKQTKTRNGWIKGKPTRFRPGHHMRAGVIERFEKKVLKQANGCWEWTGTISNGYGRFFFHGRTDWAHRFAHEQYIGPIPAGLTIDHLCCNKICVNPAHLEAVPIRVNILRGEGKAAINFKKLIV